LARKKPLAVFGEVHPKDAWQSRWMSKARPWPSPMLVENPPYPKARKTTRQPLITSALQSVERDFAFILDAQVEALNIVNAAAGADKALIAGVQVFDEFTGPKAAAQFGDGRKSVAISVRLQPVERSLTEEELDAISRKIVEKVEKATGGTLRAG
jgi:phenylalanyl-tRNA synthetase beta chain